MSPLVRPGVWPLDPPLDPSGDEGRSSLRRELLRPEYHDQDLVQRVLTWLERRVNGALSAAADAPPLSTLAAMVLFLALALALAWLLSRARRSARGPREAGAVLTAERVSADELRRRAETALAEERYGDAVVDGFRALTVRQVERGRLDDAPGATAHEVAVRLAAEQPHLAERVTAGAGVFDSVLYGDRPATREQAAAVLALDDELLARR